MFKLLNVVILIGIGGAVMAPLLYALATLRGMRHKRVYPILRVRRQDGRLSLLEEFPDRLGRAWQDY